MKVALNADLGEGFGAWRMGDDEALLPLIDSASLACGFHAGDPATMLRLVRAAAAAGLSIGAHPGLPDLIGFGRRRLEVDPAELMPITAYQIGALAGLCAVTGHPMTHVKPHGALYTMAAADPALAGAIAAAIHGVDPALILVAPAGSALAAAADRFGLRLAAEGFCDRGYGNDGDLLPRGQPGSVITDPAEVAARAVRMVRDQVVETRDGRRLARRIDTLCVHGDRPDAPLLARTIGEALAAAGITRVPLTGLDPG